MVKVGKGAMESMASFRTGEVGGVTKREWESSFVDRVVVAAIVKGCVYIVICVEKGEKKLG